WIGATIVEFFEAGVGLCGPWVVAVSEVDASVFLPPVPGCLSV
ncbi:MAG: hypothetical protein K0S10_2956, partial [Rubrobacteraceae bacterium]|nr:hypothetical protein [Rubrobacteraceae bacterium]